ncbi:hypothetical protein L226DRAFT_570006 [Lentinus tigrinus ALCF2SS1-7]|uniref:Uncharacterized protein n=1 Tax=Lentinus tigrinus ALCF2SS1-6 TaxID=1328759 RepID=A0A5C2S9M4_9APHY|nr:hypothetical protein L227DRAFT_611053 [Lentinus tigrinus ALCF2SS1-6]RPD75755.1 hypothetical protein L226DRAFT_570006 [Lentinus tigrinus ALCF2SS1-7]
MTSLFSSPLFFVVLGEGVLILLLMGIVLFQCCAAHGRGKTQDKKDAEGGYHSRATGYSRDMEGGRHVPWKDNQVRFTANTTASSGSLLPLIAKNIDSSALSHPVSGLAGIGSSHAAKSWDMSSLATTPESTDLYPGQPTAPSAAHLQSGGPTRHTLSTLLETYAELAKSDLGSAAECYRGEQVHEDPYCAMVTSDDAGDRTLTVTSRTPASSSVSSIFTSDVSQDRVSPSTQHTASPRKRDDIPPYPFLLRTGISTSKTPNESGRAVERETAERSVSSASSEGRMKQNYGGREGQRRGRVSSHKSVNGGRRKAGVRPAVRSSSFSAPQSYFDD